MAKEKKQAYALWNGRGIRTYRVCVFWSWNEKEKMRNWRGRDEMNSVMCTYIASEIERLRSGRLVPSPPSLSPSLLFSVYFLIFLFIYYHVLVLHYFFHVCKKRNTIFLFNCATIVYIWHIALISWVTLENLQI